MLKPDRVTAIKAPTYPPAIAYHRPAAAPYVFGAKTVTVEELLASPAAMAIVYREAPVMRAVVQLPTLKPLLSNFTLYSLVDFGVLTTDVADRIDVALKQLPPAQRPVL